MEDAGQVHSGEGHDHSAHGGMDMGAMDKYHGSVGRNPDGSYFYAHGAFTGHVVPGCFFIVWGTWWMVTMFEYYLRSLGSKQPFASRSWYRWPWAPRALHRLPLEPLVKVALPLLGILGELWAGHDSYRKLLADNGMFFVDHLNDWQHSSMYLAFATSGLVDLLAHATRRLPPGTEHGFLALAFIVQLQLLAFHLKGPPIEVMVHLILALQVAATVFAIFAELARPHSVLAASVRPFLTILQGVWWIQTAYIMYTGNPAWDPDYMGSTMMGPVVLAAHMLWIAFAFVAVLLLMRFLHERLDARPLPLPSVGGQEDSPPLQLHPAGLESPRATEMVSIDLDMRGEMSSLMGHKHRG